MAKIYDSTNFHKHTFCVFKVVPYEAISGLKPNYISKSGSTYYFMEKGIYRLSNHWGRAAKCKWRLQNNGSSSIERTKLGYANWCDFHPDNETGKWYFIVVNYDSKEVRYEHKNSTGSIIAAELRTASETEKTIKIIRKLLTTDNWAKHYTMEINTLRKYCINQLINTTKTLQQIKSELDRV